jgi:hypothetical protein
VARQLVPLPRIAIRPERFELIFVESVVDQRCLVLKIGCKLRRSIRLRWRCVIRHFGFIRCCRPGSLLEVRHVTCGSVCESQCHPAPGHALLRERTLRGSEQLVDALSSPRQRRQHSPLCRRVTILVNVAGMRRSVPGLLAEGRSLSHCL